MFNSSKTLTIPQLASILNIHITRCYSLVRQGSIPSIHLGRSVRVREEALLEWMRKQEHI